MASSIKRPGTCKPEKRHRILEKWWDWTKELQLKPEELGNVLCLSKYKFNQTALNMAAGEGDVEVLEKLWERSKKSQLKPEK
jgi:L-2-hydroxyglutarate oxidase LhgO